MLFSQSIIRRYTPPTCTLEIAAKASPLSRWSTNPLIKELRFELHFDDPRLPTEKKVTIGGDRDRLESLCQVVNNYVQEFLQKPSIDLPLKVQVSASSIVANGHRKTEISSLSKPIELKSLQKELVFPVTPRLQPKGLLYHELFFGSLANETSGRAIQLSAVQLCDLATALDEYSADLTVLPNLDRAEKIQYFAGWVNAAAIILAVGVTGGIAFFYQNRLPNEAIVSQKESQPNPTPTQLQPIAVLPPLPPKTQSSPPPTNLPNSLADRQKLLPPAPVSVPQAPTPIASKVKTERTETAKSSTSANREVAIAIESNTPTKKPSSNLQSSSSARKDIQQNTPQTTTTIPTKVAPQLPSLPPLTSERVAESEADDRGIAPSAPTIVGNSGFFARSRSIPSNLQGDTPEDKLTAAYSDNLSEEPDRLTQVQQYFARQWQPQEGLNKALEYRLLLDSNGSLKQVIPLGEISTLYLDRTNMPPLDRQIVSPNASKDSSLIRLVLEPDGKVRTFLE